MPISVSVISRSASRSSSNSSFAFFVFDPTRLQNISASSSRTRIRALCTRHAINATRLTGVYAFSSDASAASASPAKSVTFRGATPSVHTPDSPSLSSHSSCAISRLKCDQVGLCANFFSRLYCVVPSVSRSSRSRSSPARSAALIRS